MGKGKPDSGREASARVMLYETIARLREESGKSLAELQELTTYDRAYLHKLETGARLGSPQVVRRWTWCTGRRTNCRSCGCWRGRKRSGTGTSGS